VEWFLLGLAVCTVIQAEISRRLLDRVRLLEHLLRQQQAREH
jgi:hypothetical protein